MKRLISVGLLVVLFTSLFSPVLQTLASVTEMGFVPQITMVSVNLNGEPAVNGSTSPVVSGDGRYVAFISYATDLVEEDVNDYQDVFVRDMLTGTVSIASVSSSGEQANYSSSNPAISDDGRYVAFQTSANNLVPGETYNQNIYVHDMMTGSTSLVSISSGGTPANRDSFSPSISADGRFISFQSYATNLSPHGVEGIFVHDRDADDDGVFDEPGEVNTILVNIATDGTAGNAGGYDSVLSGNGRFVVFASLATNLVPSDTNDFQDIFLHDRDFDEDGIYDEPGEILTELISVSTNGTQPTDSSYSPSVSADGRYVSFTSRARNIVPELGGTYLNAMADVFVRDRLNGTTVRITNAFYAVYPDEWYQASGGSASRSYLSADGRYVAFSSYQYDLVAENSGYDKSRIYVHDRDADEDGIFDEPGETLMTRVSMGYWTGEFGLDPDGNSYGGDISADGRYVTFYSYATNLVPGDTSWADCFLAYLDRTPPTWPAGSSLKAENVGQTMLTLTWDPAEDEGRVASYRIYGDEKLEWLWGRNYLSDVFGGVTSKVISGLTPNTEYTFWVEAIDGYMGNMSEDGPSLTVRTEAVGGTAVLNVTAAKGGLAYLSWDPAPAGTTGFKVYRASGGQPAVTVAEISDPATLMYQDSGLAAQTTYTFQIKKLDSGGESTHTVPVDVTTPALEPITSITWDVPRINRMAALGSPLTIDVWGEYFRQVEADLTYRTWLDESDNLLPEPRLAQVTFAVPELLPGYPGHYRYDFILENGVTEVLSVTARLGDGAGHQVTREQVINSPYTSGAVRVDVIAAADSLIDCSLIAWSDSRGSGNQVGMEDGGAYLVSGLAAALDYTVRILRDDGRVLAMQENVSVTAGLMTDLSMSPSLPAWVHLQVQDPSTAGIADMLVTFNDAATGEYLGWGRTDSTGWLTYLEEAISGDTVKAAVRAELPWRSVSETRTLVPGQNEIILQVERLAEGIVSGNVTESGGTAVPGAVITASQVIDGQSFNRRAVADENGVYNIVLFEGDARMEATSLVPSHSAAIAEVTVDPASPVVRDFVLDGTGTGTISLEINIDLLGQDAQPLDMDWPTVLKFNVHLDGAIVNGSGYPISIRGIAGASVNVTVDGTWCNLPKMTQTVVLDENRSATATFNLVETGAKIQGRVVYKNGDGAGGWYAWTLQESIGRWSSYPLPGSGVSGDETLEIGVRDPGHYQFRIEPPQPWPQIYQALGQMVPVTVFELTVTSDDIASGRIFEQGDIYLQVDRFTGTTTITTPGSSLTWQEPVAERSSYTALRQYVAPGSQLTYRATYHNIGGLTINDVVMSFDIPRGTTLIPGSITVNNVQVSGNITGNNVDVPLGTILPGDTGVVYFQVRLPSDMGAQKLVSTASMRWKTGASVYELEESLGRAEVEVIGITLDAPKMTASLNMALSGRALTGGSAVRVYDQNVLLGEAPVSEGGFWKLDVELPYTGSPAWHRLQAVMESYTYGNLYSKQVNVFFDPEQPELEKIVFSHLTDNYRTISSREIIPSAGIARFPIAFHVGEILEFELTFDRPEIVGEVKVRMGGTGGGEADAVFEDGVFRAYLEINEGSLGSISYSYMKKYPPEIYHKAPLTEEELRSTMAWPANEFVIDSSTWDEENNTALIEFTIGDIHMILELFIQAGVDYTPSDEELAYADIKGIPVYGFNQSYSLESDGILTSFSGFIPEEAISLPTIQSLLSRPISSDLLTADERGEVYLSSAFLQKFLSLQGNLKAVINPVNLTDWTLSLMNAIGSPDGFYRLEQLLEQIDNTCGECASCANLLRARVELLAQDILVAHIIKAGLDFSALLMAPETLGLSLSLLGAKTAVGNLMDARNDAKMVQLQEDIDRLCPLESSDDPTTDLTDIPFADPVWLIDPSGYVYEVVPENRLEGVTATLLYQDPDTGDWTPWDAEWFGQTNPQITDAEGRYAWDVPEGNWKVAYEKDGYETAFSDVLPVPPPQLDVNVAMVSREGPGVIEITAMPAGTGIEIDFDTHVRSTTLTDTTVSIYPAGSENATVNGTSSAISPVTCGAWETATGFLFTPDTALSEGEEYVVRIDSLVQSYAGRPMATDYETTVIIPAAPITPPPPEEPVSGGGSGGGGGGGGGGSGATDDKRFTNISGSSTTEGVLWETVTALSVDIHLELVIPEGTKVLNVNGYPPLSITVATLADPGDKPENKVFIGSIYDITPNGLTFDPFAILNAYYDEDTLPEGVSEENLCIYTFNPDTQVWEALDCNVDVVNHCISVHITHLCRFAIIAGTLPPEFSLEPLNVPQGNIEPGDALVISTSVTNVGDLTGSYKAIFTVNGVEIETKSVTIASGDTAAVSFSLTAGEPGTYNIAIGNRKGTFTVVEPVVPTPTPLTPTQTQSVSELAPEPTPTATTGPAITTQPEPTGTVAATAPEHESGLAWWVIALFVLAGVIALFFIGRYVWKFRGT